MAEPSIYGEIAQAIPVVVGGLLAVGGGVMAQVVTHRLALSREERNLRRERLEALVKALYAHNQWLDERLSIMVFRNEDHDKPSPLDEVRMIQALHFPELATEVNLVVQGELPLFKFIAEQRIAHSTDAGNFFKQFDNTPYLEGYKLYIFARNVTVAKCRTLLISPEPTILKRLQKFLKSTASKMDGK
jgi:hypothetical protein